MAAAQEADPSAREAFEAARQLGTAEAWQAFLARYRTGFYADLARAYLKQQGAEAPGATTPPAPAAVLPPTGPAPVGQPPPPPPVPSAAAPASTDDAPVPPTDPSRPALPRGARFMGFPERFNRYYTDPAWRPARLIYVGPDGQGDGATRDSPASAQAAVAAAQPGTFIHFNRGAYRGCFEFTPATGGTYDAPVVLYGERTETGALGVTISCCGSGRQTCFNLEGANHVAVDGFELVGGRYGVRAVGLGYAASQHAQGIAVMNCDGHDQNNDPLFSGQVDWAVWERNRAHGAGQGDGHGLYISNGSDWNIVRFNETFNNPHSDFQVNADPASTCKDVGIAFTDPRCDAFAGEGEGGQGASDYFLIDSNRFHHNPGPGVNFTSLRRSLIRNNVFGFNARHNVSFWQETDNPKLGSRENRILHNLFVSTGRHGVQFINHSTLNDFANNVVVGIQPGGAANPSALLMETDGTVGENAYRGNLYSAGRCEGRSPGASEMQTPLSPAWFARFPSGPGADPNELAPGPNSPLLGRGALLPEAPTDRNGMPRSVPADLGPVSARAAVVPGPSPGAATGAPAGPAALRPPGASTPPPPPDVGRGPRPSPAR